MPRRRNEPRCEWLRSAGIAATRHVFRVSETSRARPFAPIDVILILRTLDREGFSVESDLAPSRRYLKTGARLHGRE
jgi:hypothetical protein